jgi:alcohol dehydrogenase
VIDKVYPLEEAGQAFHYLEGGSAKGKVVIRIK